jgi:hypothetical protein
MLNDWRNTFPGDFPALHTSYWIQEQITLVRDRQFSNVQHNLKWPPWESGNVDCNGMPQSVQDEADRLFNDASDALKQQPEPDPEKAIDILTRAYWLFATR